MKSLYEAACQNFPSIDVVLGTVLSVISIIVAVFAVIQSGRALTASKILARPWLYFHNFELGKTDRPSVITVKAELGNSGSVPSTKTKTLFKIGFDDEIEITKLEEKSFSGGGDVVSPKRTVFTESQEIDLEISKNDDGSYSPISFIIYTKYVAAGFQKERILKIQGKIYIEEIGSRGVQYEAKFGPEDTIST